MILHYYYYSVGKYLMYIISVSPDLRTLSVSKRFWWFLLLLAPCRLQGPAARRPTGYQACKKRWVRQEWFEYQDRSIRLSGSMIAWYPWVLLIAESFSEHSGKFTLARANLNQLRIRPIGSLREEQSQKFAKTHATLQIGLQWSQSSMGALGLCGPLAIHQGSWRVDQKLGSLVDERLWHKSAKSWAACWRCLILSRYCTSQDPALEESEWEAAT